MRPQEGYVCKPRRILFSEPADEFAGHERGLGFIPGILRRHPRNLAGLRTDGNMDIPACRILVAARAQPGKPLPFMFRQQLPRGETWEKSLVGRQMRIARIETAWV